MGLNAMSEPSGAKAGVPRLVAYDPVARRDVERVHGVRVVDAGAGHGESCAAAPAAWRPRSLSVVASAASSAPPTIEVSPRISSNRVDGMWAVVNHR